ncbi:MAG: phosphoesterase [Methanomicrobiaceae archaeon]|nr:phosphoesterase [Methanomicrobiaceae archaeon]
MGRKEKESPGNGIAALARSVSQRGQQVVHLTHNDLDAVGGDALHRRKYGDIFTIWCSVSAFLPMLEMLAGLEGKGDTLSISDLGYQPGAVDLIARIRERGWRIEWRDHHRWQPDEESAVAGLAALLHIDTETCATGIIAQDLLPDDLVAEEIAAVVCDYDLWHHRDPRSKVLGQAVMEREMREYVRDVLVSGRITDARIEEIYAEVVARMEREISRSIAHARVVRDKYLIAFAPLYGFPSETAHAIRDALGTDIEVVVSPGGRFSIRSVPPISHLIAREFGGGGHPHAAGGTFPFTIVDRILFLLLNYSRYFSRLVAVAKNL